MEVRMCCVVKVGGSADVLSGKVGGSENVLRGEGGWK